MENPSAHDYSIISAGYGHTFKRRRYNISENIVNIKNDSSVSSNTFTISSPTLLTSSVGDSLSLLSGSGEWII
jgi:hypothetical protein